MAVTAFWYGNGLLAVMGGTVDLNTDSFKAMLTTSSYSPLQDTHDFRDDVTNEISGTGYTAGGAAVTSPTLTYDGASNECRWDHSDPNWTSATFTAAKMVVYKARGGAASADELLYWVNFGADETVTSGTFTYVVPATGTAIVVPAVGTQTPGEMLNLALTTDKLQLVTSSAANIDVHASWLDLLSGAVTPGKQNTTISSATTTDIVGSPDSSTIRNVKMMSIRNRHASTSCDVTVVFDASGTDYELHKVTLAAGEMLQFTEGTGFAKIPVATIAALKNFSTVAQSSTFTADTYVTGSAILIGAAPLAGSLYKLKFDVTKGGGTGAPVLQIRLGTAGTTADTSRCSFTWSAGTGVADTSTLEVWARFRSVGSSTSAVLVGQASSVSQPTTGYSSLIKSVVTVSSGFDSTVAGLIIGASLNGGTSFAGTVQMVHAEFTF